MEILFSFEEFKFNFFSFLQLHRCRRAVSEISQLRRSRVWTSGCKISLMFESVICPCTLIILMSLSFMLGGKGLMSVIYLEIFFMKHQRHPLGAGHRGRPSEPLPRSRGRGDSARDRLSTPASSATRSPSWRHPPLPVTGAGALATTEGSRSPFWAEPWTLRRRDSVINQREVLGSEKDCVSCHSAVPLARLGRYPLVG